MQDFTGVPAVVDLAAMRDAMQALGGDPEKINPLVPVDLVIDHSVIVDYFGDSKALQARTSTWNTSAIGERYEFLQWGQKAFDEFPRRAARHRHLPPGQSRISRPDGVDRQGEDDGGRRRHLRGRLSRHARRHRFAHHHGQRPRRARLGRRRHRGRSRDARPADLDADPGSHRLQADRQAARKA